MGLDMYLSARVSAYKSYGDAKPDRSRNVLAHAAEKLGLPESDNIDCIELTREVAYWRKVNAVHAWFVKNVQAGEDRCQRSPVEREQLQELRDLCATLVATKDEAEAAKLLPPQEGFFFGDTAIDQYYWDDLADTVRQLDKALALPEHVQFEYQASW